MSCNICLFLGGKSYIHNIHSTKHRLTFSCIHLKLNESRGRLWNSTSQLRPHFDANRNLWRYHLSLHTIKGTLRTTIWWKWPLSVPLRWKRVQPGDLSWRETATLSWREFSLSLRSRWQGWWPIIFGVCYRHYPVKSEAAGLGQTRDLGRFCLALWSNIWMLNCPVGQIFGC